MFIKAILVLIMFFCSISLFQLFKNKRKIFVNNLLTVSLLFVFIHALHVFICDFFFPALDHGKRTGPYGLVYGPLFYFLFLGLNKNKVKLYIFLLHLIPFIVFAIIYIVFLFDDRHQTINSSLYIKILYAAIPISFVGYVVVSFFQKPKFSTDVAFLEIKEFVNTIGLILLFIAIFFYVVGTTGGNETNAARLIVYTSMLASVIYIFKHLTSKKRKIINFSKEVDSDFLDSKNKEKYTKVKITKEQLDDYEKKMYLLMNESEVFLDIDLSLNKLSKELKIPKYHLTQLFSLRIGKNFNQFINSYRINFACDLLLKNKDIKIEDFIYQCGFNSKSSFNRHFKMIMNSTPSEYSAQKRE